MKGENMHLIYKITNLINLKSYIGQSQNVEKRWTDHIKGRSRSPRMCAALKKYKQQSFCFEIVAFCEDQIGANEIETKLIALYDTVKCGYNVNPTAYGSTGRANSEETRAKLSAALRGRKKPARSEEHRRNLSTSRKGSIRGDIKGELNHNYGKTGEDHPASKLTNVQRKQIIALFNTGNYTKKQLAEQFYVSTFTIYNLTRSNNYEHDNV